MYPEHEEVVLSYSNYRNRDLLVAIAKSYDKVVADESGNEYI